MSILILPLLWLLPCALQDHRTRTVSNWLTLPALAVALLARLLGWVTTPWWLTILVSGLALLSWARGWLGGADAKGWLVFALLGEFVLFWAACGLVVWYFAANLARKIQQQPVEPRLPGFPGYFFGLTIGLLLAILSP